MDPHKRSATIEVMVADEAIEDGGRFMTDRDGYAAMLRYAQQWPERAAGTSRIGWCTTAKPLVDGPAKLTGAGS
jgi:transposase